MKSGKIRMYREGSKKKKPIMSNPKVEPLLPPEEVKEKVVTTTKKYKKKKKS